MSDVLIIGGGAIGLTTAWELAGRGLAVTVLDQSELGTEASWAGAGMIPPGDLDPAPGAQALMALSREIWPQLSQSLQTDTGIDNGYRRCGGLHVNLVHPEFLRAMTAGWRRIGVPAELIGSAAIRELEPQLTVELEEALFLPTMAQVRNPRHLKALKAACEVRGVRLRPNHHVTAWDIRDSKMTSRGGPGTIRYQAYRYRPLSPHPLSEPRPRDRACLALPAALPRRYRDQY